MNIKNFFVVCYLSVLILALSPAFADEPLALQGQEVFRLCEACHSVEPGVHIFGPTLHGVYQRQAGTQEGYSYSQALANSGIDWNESYLHRWLASDSKNLVPGTRMQWRTQLSEEQLQALIAYLKTLRD